MISTVFDDVPRIIGREINTFDACCDRHAVLTAVKTSFSPICLHKMHIALQSVSTYMTNSGMVWYGMVCTWNLFVFYFVLVAPPPKNKVRIEEKSHGTEAMILDEEFRRGETLESDAWFATKERRKICYEKLENICNNERWRGQFLNQKTMFFFLIFSPPTSFFWV